MNSQIELIEGSTRDFSKSQYFTPPKLAAKLVEWADIPDAFNQHYTRAPRVLEPSAGNGALVRPLVAAGAEVTAIELDTRYSQDLRDALKADAAWMGESFLDFQPHDMRMRPAFDLCVGNFPFHLDLQGEFTLHALKFARRVCAIYPANVFYSEQRGELWRAARPTRIAHIAKRPWPGATDYVALELVRRGEYDARIDTDTRVEFWPDSWT